MFNNLNKPAFGSTPSNTGFGFGQSQLFGKPAGSSFGAAPAFGQTSSTSLFPASQSQTGGLFQSSNTPAFGTTSTAQTGFGSSTLFGTPQQQPSGSGLFGSNAFGQQNKPASFGFGASASQASIFGQAQPTTAQNTTSLFQPSTSTSLFGTGTSTFGSAVPTGTGAVKFVPLTGTDTMQKSGITNAINTKHHCITCMKEYEQKSLEELRWEDYQAGRKGPQQTGFGAMPFQSNAQPTSSIFGQPTTTQPTFGQSTGFGTGTTGFGMGTQNTTSQGLFSKPATGFGAPTTTANTFGFGSNTTTQTPFGGAAVNKPFGTTTTPSLFGATTTQTSTFGSNLFTQNTQQNTGGLFGKPTQSTTSFNSGTGFQFATPQTQSGSLFSAPKPTTAFPSFGQTTSTSTFGQQQQPFGQTNQLSFGSSFAKPANPGFGQTTQTSFGTGLGLQQNSLFGNTNKTGNLFGSTNTGSSLFGNTTMQQTGSLFNQQPQQQQTFQSPTQPQHQEFRSVLTIGDHFGHMPQLSGLAPVKPDYSVRATNPKEIEALLHESPPLKNDMGGGDRIRLLPAMSKKPSIFDGILDPLVGDANASLKKSRKRLLINKIMDGAGDSLHTTSSLHVSLDQDSDQDDGLQPIVLLREDTSIMKNKELDLSRGNTSTPRRLEQPAPSLYPNLGALNFDNGNSISSSPKPVTPNSTTNWNVRINNEIDFTLLQDHTRQNSKGDLEHDARAEKDENDAVSNKSTETRKYCGVILTRPEYYTIPPLEELEQYTDDEGRCMVEGFTIGRVGYGNVYFPDKFDISNINIDKDVHFRHKELTVYPDEATKPPVGEKLNRRAQVTLDRVWPRSKEDNKVITDPDEIIAVNFSENLQKACERLNSKFLEYRPDSGSWVFMVDHFSKYSLVDTEETVDMEKLKRRAAHDQSTNGFISIQAEERPKKTTVIEEAAAVFDEESTTLSQEQEEPSDSDELDEPPKDMPVAVQVHESARKTYMRLSAAAEATERMAATLSNLPAALLNGYKRNVQLMKASFFEQTVVPNLFSQPDDASSTQTVIDQYMDLSTPPSPGSSSVDMEGLPEVDVQLQGVQVYEVNGYQEVPIVFPRNYIDLAVFKGKSFKVGWQKGNSFLTYSVRDSCDSEEGTVSENVTCPYRLELSRLNGCKPVAKINPAETIIQSLMLLHEHCKVVVDESGCPFLRLQSPLEFLTDHRSLVERTSKDDINDKQNMYFKHVWNLCAALWGPGTNGPCYRRNLFSLWLEEAIAELPESQLQTNDSNILRRIFGHLAGHNINEAAQLASKQDFPQLSLLISQCSTSHAKVLIQEQLTQWKEMDAFKFIDENMLKIYMIVSGVPVLEDQNICDGSSWLQNLALHLWYVSPYHLGLADAVDSYTKAFKELGYAKRPRPPYSETSEHFDVLYHLMLLFSNRELTLNEIVNPSSYTDDTTDYRLGWLLMQTLSALNVGVITENSKNHAHTSFALQLEAMGNWEFAIFVLLFMKNSKIKKNLIFEVMGRNMPINYLDGNSTDNCKFLVNDLGVPKKWIHQVLANKCRLERNYYGEYRHLFFIGNYKDSHNVALEKLIPTLIASEDYAGASEILAEFEDKQDKIENWQNCGGFILDFLVLEELFANNKHSPDFSLHIQELLISVCQRIKSFPRCTPTLTLCASEISKACRKLLHTPPADNLSLDLEKYLIENS